MANYLLLEIHFAAGGIAQIQATPIDELSAR
jgi:hypothetical protein